MHIPCLPSRFIDDRSLKGSTTTMVRTSQNDLAKSIELLQRAIRKGPPDANKFNELGLCWLALRDGVRAADAFRKEVALAPRAVQGYYNLGDGA